jgi:ankyrin repeat protein
LTHEQGQYDVHSLAKLIEHAQRRDPDFGVRRPRWPHTRKNMTNQEIAAVMLQAEKTGYSSPLSANILGKKLMNAVNRDNKTAVKNILIANRNAAKYADNTYGWLPLHHAASSGGRNVVRALVKANPNALKHADYGGQLPLHHAAYSRNPNVVRAIANAYPNAAQRADQFGQLPLHIAARFRNPNVVRAIVNAYPSAAQRASDSGWLPLHTAVYSGNPNVVSVLVNAYPNAAQRADKNGRLPLHYARDPNVVRALQAEAHKASLVGRIRAALRRGN